ncbi:hypothetical protein GA0061084_2864 [Arthrobacter sp. NIO-1057]|nr:hypothetical protein GA0061084_2864 [Arthrobacter sp. NIO-1057]
MKKRQESSKLKNFDSTEFHRRMREHELKNHVPVEMYLRIR